MNQAKTSFVTKFLGLTQFGLAIIQIILAFRVYFSVENYPQHSPEFRTEVSTIIFFYLIGGIANLIVSSCILKKTKVAPTLTSLLGLSVFLTQLFNLFTSNVNFFRTALILSGVIIYIIWFTVNKDEFESPSKEELEIKKYSEQASFRKL